MAFDNFSPENVLSAKDRAGDLVRENRQQLSGAIFDDMKQGFAQRAEKAKPTENVDFLDFDTNSLYGAISEAGNGDAVHGARSNTKQHSRFGGAIRNSEESRQNDDGSSSSSESNWFLGFGHSKSEETQADGSSTEKGSARYPFVKDSYAITRGADGSSRNESTWYAGAEAGTVSSDRNADGTTTESHEYRILGGLYSKSDKRTTQADGTTTSTSEETYFWGIDPFTTQQESAEEGERQDNSEPNGENGEEEVVVGWPF